MNAQTTIEAATLASAMAAAFGEIEAATKDAVNPAFKQGGKVSKYADLTSVIAAVKPALIRHGLFFTQHPEPSETGVCVETFLHHAGGESLSLGKLFVPAAQQNAHGFGSALTYARRYALVTAFGVPVEDDDGNAAARGQNQGSAASPPPPVGAHPISDEAWAKIVNLCKATGATSAQVKEHIGAANLKVLTVAQFDAAVDFLESKLAEAAKAETAARAKETA